MPTTNAFLASQFKLHAQYSQVSVRKFLPAVSVTTAFITHDTYKTDFHFGISKLQWPVKSNAPHLWQTTEIAKHISLSSWRRKN